MTGCSDQLPQLANIVIAYAGHFVGWERRSYNLVALRFLILTSPVIRDITRGLRSVDFIMCVFFIYYSNFNHFPLSVLYRCYRWHTSDGVRDESQ